MKYMLAEVDVPFRVAIVGVVFFAFFIALIFYVYSRSRTKRYQHISSLPLEDGIAVEKNIKTMESN